VTFVIFYKKNKKILKQFKKQEKIKK